jgi:hypothetical protein
MGRCLGHASARAGRAKATTLTAEGQQDLFLAGLTSQAQKPVGQDTALKIVVKLTLHISGQALGIGVVLERGEKRFQVFRNCVVEHRTTRIMGFIGGNSRCHVYSLRTTLRLEMTGHFVGTILYIGTVFKYKLMGEDKDANTVYIVLASATYGVFRARCKNAPKSATQLKRDDSLTGDKQMAGHTDHKATVAAASIQRGIILRRLYHGRQLGHSKSERGVAQSARSTSNSPAFSPLPIRLQDRHHRVLLSNWSTVSGCRDA